jgi:hypothetical protein
MAAGIHTRPFYLHCHAKISDVWRYPVQARERRKHATSVPLWLTKASRQHGGGVSLPSPSESGAFRNCPILALRLMDLKRDGDSLARQERVGGVDVAAGAAYCCQPAG